MKMNKTTYFKERKKFVNNRLKNEIYQSYLFFDTKQNKFRYSNSYDMSWNLRDFQTMWAEFGFYHKQKFINNLPTISKSRELFLLNVIFEPMTDNPYDWFVHNIHNKTPQAIA